MAKPIILTKENVLATMEGRKTMTRRVIKPQPPCSLSQIEGTGTWTYTCSEPEEEWKPKYQVGDEVYVAEGYQITKRVQDNKRANVYGGIYLADKQSFEVQLQLTEAEKFRKRKFPNRPTSGRFMYKSLARTFMRITEVKFEMLQDIRKNPYVFCYRWELI
jgi:hypothetical protein